jgi:hypothetical protein
MGKISGQSVKGYWYNPRSGTNMAAGTYPNSGVRDFVPPSQGFGSDWVLVLDDAAKTFPLPGQTAGAPHRAEYSRKGGGSRTRR